ncbi:glycosyltransferase family 4 protein [bacterium]|nr:glycosyltransferase family 4 protein [bacterium]MBU1883790.1 glycosyltransferase family 4 protein [bacterium]
MIYLFLFLLSFTLTYLIKNYAIKRSLIDIPNDRSSHTLPTPHGGGIAIAITWFVGLVYLYINHQIEQNLFYPLMLGMIISAVSYIDDLFELSARIRLLAQTFIAISGLYLLGGLHSLNFGIFVIENQIFTNLFALFLIVWFINLYNFLDGIDGYAGSEAIFLALAGFLLFGGTHFLVFAFAVSGFLVWNWQRAKIFMGDVGSTLLGYNIAIFTIYYANQESTDLWAWVILFGLFWFDATLTLFRRYKNGEKLSQAHKKHAYQRVVQSGWSHSKTVKYSILVNMILLGFVYFISNIFVAFIVTLVLLYMIMMFIDKKKAFM